MRPDTDAVVARSGGRAGFVFVGSVAASALVLHPPTAPVLAVLVGGVVATMTATAGSRWYVTPAFTTFLVFVLLLWGHPDDTAWRFVLCNAQTLIGVSLALLFGVAVLLRARRVADR